MKQKFKFIVLFLLMFICIQTSTFATDVKINSEAGILVEVSTGRILYEKNSTKQMYPASTTKILTAILVLENCNLTDTVTEKQH